MFKKLRNHNGFTLIEMMVVIAIVAILVSIVVPVVNTSQIKAKASVDAANLRSMAATVATRYVSTSDPDELLSDLETPDSRLVENSNIIFYVVDEQELYAYYCTSLLFPQRLRGTGYNGRVATSGNINEPYDTLPEGAVRLCALTSTGNAYDDEKLTEIADLANKYDGLFDEVIDDFYDNADNSEESKFLTGLANQVGNTDAAIKMSLIDALVDKYGYSYEEALEMVDSGAFTSAMVDATNLPEEDKTNLKNTLNKLQEDTTITYSACAHYGCGTSGCTKVHRYTNNETGNNSEFLQYCARYNLEPVYPYNDHVHG